MFTRTSILLLIVVSFCSGQTSNRQCAPDTIDFATKVDKSPVVVYGKTMAKIMNEGSDSTFHVFFQVDCVLKGPATLRQINITNAGRVEGKQYCQEFPIGRGYAIAFVEPSSMDTTDNKTFIPVDFAEVLDEGNSTSELLARTCSFHRIVPQQSLASVDEVCPSVATDPICLETINSTVMMPMDVPINSTDITLTDGISDVSNKTVVIIDEKGRLAQPIHSVQQEIEAIRGKSGSIQVDVDENNGGQFITFNILLLIMALHFCSN